MSGDGSVAVADLGCVKVYQLVLDHWSKEATSIDVTFYLCDNFEVVSIWHVEEASSCLWGLARLSTLRSN